MKAMSFVGLTALAIAVSGCGGGSGGKTAFTAFSKIAASDTTRMTGDARLVSYDIDQDTGEVTAADTVEATARVDLTTNEFFALVAASITTVTDGTLGAAADARFSIARGDTFADGDTLDPLAQDFALAASADGDRAAIVADPSALGFEYQTFGIWATGIDGGSGVAGVAAVGAPTPAAAVQGLGGEATYNGKSAGFYVDAMGAGYFALADFEATVDFDNQEIDVATSNTGVIDMLTGASMAMASLDFAGSGPASVGGPFGGPADGTFEADIAAIGLDLSGTMDGRLNGPNGEEINGLFEMTGDDGRYVGGVGAVD